jgi:hypothetical protein
MPMPLCFGKFKADETSALMYSLAAGKAGAARSSVCNKEEQ